MNKIEHALVLLKNWKTNDPSKIKRFIKHFYDYTGYEKNRSLNRRVTYIIPDSTSIDNREELLENLYNMLDGQEGVENLITYLLENDRHYENTDTLTNYADYKPYPSYLIKFAYLLIHILPKRSRRLFDTFWDYQSKTFPGIYEQSARAYVDSFIKEGITTEKEIQDLLIRDWVRWQEVHEDSPYYGPAIGIATWYFPNYGWFTVEKKLQNEWRQKTGREPKK